MRDFATFALLIQVLLSAGCYSTTALIVHKGETFEEKTKGKIVAGDKQAVYIEPDRAQGVMRIEKKEISLLKHPGESKALPALLIAAGLVAGIAGGIAFFDGLSDDSDHDVVKDIKVTGGGIALAVGVAALGLGIPALIASNASEADSLERMKTPPTPPSARIGVHGTFKF